MAGFHIRLSDMHAVRSDFFCQSDIIVQHEGYFVFSAELFQCQRLLPVGIVAQAHVIFFPGLDKSCSALQGTFHAFV